MGTTLTGTTPATTYDSLIKVTDNGPISGTAKYLSDGLGNDSVLALSTGAAGVGTTTMTRKFNIDGGSITSDTPTLRISSTDGSGTRKFGIEFYSNSGADVRGKLLADNSGKVYLDDNGGGGIVLQANGGTGNVGIGNTSPQGNLDVKGSTDVAVFLRNASNGDTNTDGLLLGNVGGIPASYQIWNYENGFLRFGTNASERVRIDSAGKVGINTTSALGQLNIKNESAGATTNALALYNTPSNTENTGVAIEFYPNVGVDDRCARISSVNPTTTGTNLSDLRFFTSNNAAPTEKMRITHTGNVGIGTDAPESRLHAAGSAAGSDVTLYIDNAAPSTLNNSSRLKFSSDAGSNVSGGGAELNCLVVTAVNGAVDLLVKSWTGGAYTEKARFLAGGGLTFNGDTAAANALDDYEEGTFTPTFAPTSGAFTSITYSEQYGKYTKIGNRVDVNIKITASSLSVGTASGVISIAGLPFTVGSQPCPFSITLVLDWDSGKFPVSGFFNDGGANCLLRYVSSLNSNDAYIGGSEITNTSSITLSGTYFV